MLILASISLLMAITATSDPADDALVTWRAPPECPSVEVALSKIRRSVADLAIDPTTSVRAEVMITRERPQRYRLDLALDVGDGPGERTLSAESCEEAVDTAAWLIAIAIDVRAVDPAGPEERSTATTPPGSPEPGSAAGMGADGFMVPRPDPGAVTSVEKEGTLAGEPTEPGRKATEAATGRPQAPAPRRRLHMDLWAGGGVGVGVLPAATPVAGGGLALSGRRWQVELGGYFWARRHVALAGKIGGRFEQGHTSLRGCAAWEVGPARLSPCGGLAVGLLRAEGSGPVVARTAHSLWVGLLIGAQVWLRLHTRVRLALQADAVVGLRRPGFTLEPTHTLLFRLSPVGFSGLVALVVRLR